MSGPRDWRPDGWNGTDDRGRGRGRPKPARRRLPRRGSFRRGSFGRGVMMALLVAPPAVVAWLLLWQYGITSSVIALGVALGAARLFRWGSGGLVSVRGSVAICAIVVGTILICVGAAVVMSGVQYYPLGGQTGDTLGSPAFWQWFADVFLANPASRSIWLGNLAIALVISAIGVAPLVLQLRQRVSPGERLAIISIPVLSVVASVVLIATVMVGGGTMPGIRPGVAEPGLSLTAAPREVGTCSAYPLRADGTPDESVVPGPVGCELPHTSEVFSVLQLVGDGMPVVYPGVQEVTRLAQAGCAGPMGEFLGIAQADTRLTLEMTYPSQQSWEAESDRRVTCAVADPPLPTVGTLRGVAR